MPVCVCEKKSEASVWDTPMLARTCCLPALVLTSSPPPSSSNPFVPPNYTCFGFEQVRLGTLAEANAFRARRRKLANLKEVRWRERIVLDGLFVFLPVFGGRFCTMRAPEILPLHIA